MVMRFQRGSKVEVLRTVEVPPRSWHCAEIVCVNGCDYTVKYAGTSNEKIVEKVSRKAIRPCPPPCEFSENWVSGDVVEVFDDYSWKMATVSKALEKMQYLVRLIGSSLEFKISRADIRVRQSWQDDKWVVIGKGSGSCEDGKHDESLCLKYNQNLSSQAQKTKTRVNLQAKVDCFPVENKATLQESHFGSSRKLKRGSPYKNSQVEGCAGAAKKIRVVKDGRFLQVIAATPCTLPKHVEAVGQQRKMVGENCVHVSSNNRRTGYSGMDIERRKSNDAGTVTCSVGSCSITSNNLYELPHTGPTEESGNLSDAESFCQWGYKEGNRPLPTGEELAAEIHRIELHAYRCTIGALHASGPLSWEQEALVTNLRLLLNISNDEHLMEIRNLISADNCIPNR